MESRQDDNKSVFESFYQFSIQILDSYLSLGRCKKWTKKAKPTCIKFLVAA